MVELVQQRERESRPRRGDRSVNTWRSPASSARRAAPIQSTTAPSAAAPGDVVDNRRTSRRQVLPLTAVFSENVIRLPGWSAPNDTASATRPRRNRQRRRPGSPAIGITARPARPQRPSAAPSRRAAAECRSRRDREARRAAGRSRHPRRSPQAIDEKSIGESAPGRRRSTPSPWSSWSSRSNVTTRRRGVTSSVNTGRSARPGPAGVGVNRRRQQVAGHAVGDRLALREQRCGRPTVRRQRDGRRLVRPDREQVRQRAPSSTVAPPSLFAGRYRLPDPPADPRTPSAPPSRQSGTGMSFSTLMMKPPVTGTTSPSASVATRIDEKSMAISASSASFMPGPWSSWSSSVNV